MENISFNEAVERLADSANIELPVKELSPEEQRRESSRKRLYSVIGLAGDYFHNCLTKTRMGKPGLEYFVKRHLTPKTIEDFHLGFAPHEWHRLYDDFTSKKHIEGNILVEAGLCGVKDGSYFDYFRNRCMFPILNIRGNIVAFGGRVMDDSKPKYLNSPETPIFNKGCFCLHSIRLCRKSGRNGRQSWLRAIWMPYHFILMASPMPWHH